MSEITPQPRALLRSLADPFGFTQERRTERALIDEYRHAVRETLAFVGKHPQKCLELARMPEQIRGFGRPHDGGGVVNVHEHFHDPVVSDANEVKTTTEATL